ncbi:MAG TPA: hypothetical protein PLO89_02770 [Spirochaetota bacterium]|nr:hypothetical protein [Spirochaetota bacterium]
MKNIICAFLYMTSVLFLFSEDFVKVEEIFSKEDISAVLKGDILIRTYFKTNPGNFNTHLKIEVPATKWTDEDYSKYEILVDEKAFIPYEINEETKLKFYNALTSYSKLKGMVYYSMNGGEIKELILDAYRVKSENNNKKIDDETYNEVKEKLTGYFYQEDNKFGKFIFRSDFNNYGNSFFLSNVSTQGIFPINGKGDYKTITFFIYDDEKKGFFYYNLFAMRIKIGLDLLAKKTNVTLFSSRVRAVTVHLINLIGLDWSNRLRPFEEEKLYKGLYRTY